MCGARIEYAAANATLRVARDGGAPMPSMATVRGGYPTLRWRRGLSGGIAPSLMRTPTSALGAPRGWTCVSSGSASVSPGPVPSTHRPLERGRSAAVTDATC